MSVSRHISYGRIRELSKKSTIVFLWSFFLLFYIPDIFSAFIDDFTKYLWLAMCNIVFFGHHYPYVVVFSEHDTRFKYQAMTAAIILSIILAILALCIDRAHPFLVKFRSKSYPLLYNLVAKIVSLTMVAFGLMKLFPTQFYDADAPYNLMSPAGSIHRSVFVFMAYGFSSHYEIMLGALELIGAIFLWFPRTVVLGSLITCVVLTNLLFLLYFLAAPLLILVGLLFAGCIFLLSHDIPGMLYYFRGKSGLPKLSRITLLSQSGPKLKNITLRALSLCSLSAIIILLGLSDHTHYRSQQEAIHDPFYGIWDSPAESLYIGDNKLDTIGIQGHHIFLFSHNKAAGAHGIAGNEVNDVFHFSLNDTHGNPIAFTARKTSPDRLVLSNTQLKTPISLVYTKRSIYFKDSPKSIFMEDYGHL